MCMTYAAVMARLRDSRLTYQQIAEGSGVSRRTVEKIARREIVDPGVSHIEKLSRFFLSLDERERRAA